MVLANGIYAFEKKGRTTEEIQRLKEAEYFSLPEWEGKTFASTPCTHCGNCSEIIGDNFCKHKDVRAPVEPSGCCRLWEPDRIILVKLKESGLNAYPA